MKKHWYKDMHYADFAEDEVNRDRSSFESAILMHAPSQSAALLAAIKEYEASKWKVIGQKVGKPAKVRRIPPYKRVWILILPGLRAICKGTFRREGLESSSALHHTCWT